MENKKDWICAAPFTSLEIHDSRRFLCCASWLLEYLPEDSKPIPAWESEQANKIRDSILDGSYKYCDSNQCPYLHELETKGRGGRLSPPLYHKNELPQSLKDKIEEHINGGVESPEVVQFSFDRSCNLHCPSCRLTMEIADSKKIKKVKQDIQDIEDAYGKYIKVLYITGSGDPFISVGFRDFLRNFDKSKWPSLNRIHLHTNATYWTKEMWDSMKKVWPYVKSCEISIDAGTKDTYENKTRLGGDWNILIDNLKFISTIDSLDRIKTSFVVQKHNYKEMKTFYNLMNSIFSKNLIVYYGKINNWGTFSDEEYMTHKVWDESHPEHEDFLKELNDLIPAKRIYHNLQEFLKPNKGLI